MFGAKSYCGIGSVKSIFVDSGPWIALFDGSAAYHLYRSRGRQPLRNLFFEAD